MALLNLVRVATATTGTGTVTLGAAHTGFNDMADAGAFDGDTFDYAIESHFSSGVASKREQGTGVWDEGGNTLTRNVVSSTEADAPINLNGDAQVFITPQRANFREDVTAARIYYVNNDTGSDDNDGRTSGTAFATIQHAADIVCDTLYIKANVSINVEYTGTNYNEWVKLRAWQGFTRGNTDNSWMGTVQIYSAEANGGTINQPVGAYPDSNFLHSAWRAEGVGASWKITNISSDLSLATTYEVGHFGAYAGANLIVEGGHLSAVLDGGSGTAYFLAVNRSDIKWVNGGLGYSSHLYDGGVASSLFPILGQAYYSSRCEIDRIVVFDDDPAFWLVLFAQIDSAAWYGHNFTYSGTVTGQYFSMRDGSHGSSGNIVDLPGDSYDSGSYAMLNLDSTWDGVGIETGTFATLAGGGLGTTLEGYDYVVTNSNTNIIGAEITSSGSFHVLSSYIGGNWPNGKWVVAAAQLPSGWQSSIGGQLFTGIVGVGNYAEINSSGTFVRGHPMPGGSVLAGISQTFHTSLMVNDYHIQTDVNDYPDGFTVWRGYKFDVNSNGCTGGDVRVYVNNGSPGDVGDVTGLNVSAADWGDGDIGNLRGLTVNTQCNSSNTISGIIAGFFETDLIGDYSGGSGPTTVGAVHTVATTHFQLDGTVGTINGVHVGAPQVYGGTATIVEGLVIEDHSAIGVTTSNNFHSYGASTFNVFEGNVLIDKYIEIAEMSAPSAPAANKARLYVQDNGGGKTQIIVRFPSGAVQVIATEP